MEILKNFLSLLLVSVPDPAVTQAGDPKKDTGLEVPEEDGFYYLQRYLTHSALVPS